MKRLNRCYSHFSWGLFSFSGLVFAFSLSWLLMAKMDFAYGWLHDILDIEQHSQYYGPLNKYRQDFALTDKTEHVRLFAAINEAVHNQGLGLAQINYRKPDGKVIDFMLHRAEIQHLQDVANLLDTLKWPAFIASLFWILMVGLSYFSQLTTPGWIQQSKSLGLIAIIVGGVLVIVGPQQTFYVLHEWVFPKGHQWYFYYEESLMSTIMKAPDLFGVIAIELTGVALIVLALLHWISNRLCRSITLTKMDSQSTN